MDLSFLLHVLLPVVAVVASAAQSVAHAWIAAKHQPDHSLIIDKVAAALGGFAQRANPAPQDQTPASASATP